ncbi:MAG: hypothetical protein ABIB79_03730 [archaeon]
MKKNQKYILGSIVVGAIVIWALFIGFSKTVDEGVTGRESILTESLAFSDENMQGQITKNKLTNTASIDISFSINDTDEYMDFFGEKVTAVPMMVNLFCGLFTTAFFNPSALQELQSEGNITSENNDLTSLVGDTTIQSAKITFIDKETNQKIADCTATGANWEDIKFNVYRDYSDVGSLFGAQIGETLEN